MRITQFTDFSLRMLMYLAANRGRLVSVGEIAEHHGISGAHLRKVVGKLTESGHIRAVRGKNGGMALAREPEEINLGALLRAHENLTMLPCFDSAESCPQEDCKLGGLTTRALDAFLAVWDERSLADIL